MSARVVAVIPARGGSKGVPGKNVARVGGVPLIVRAVRAVLASGRVDVAYVSTDDLAIAEAAREAGGRVIERPAMIAGDLATSEAALLHALDVIEELDGPPDVLVFVQATSPFIPPAAIATAVDRVLDGGEDVVFSATATHAFLWKMGDAGAEGVNHDHSFRPRRQDREPHYQETGAFYVMDVAGFRTAKFRFFGRIGFVEVDAARAIEVDTPEDLAFARAIAPHFETPEPVAARALVMDFDGVHTDDTAMVSEDGVESVTVSRSDGMGLAMLREAGVPMLILSKERNPVVAARGAKLHIEVIQAVDDKAEALQRWAASLGIPLSDVAYVGNDINDALCLGLVGWPVVVPDAPPKVRESARVTLTRPGGRGAIRELAELILATRK